MIIITGQTATGKTKLALKYAKKYNGELINFDSRQIYQYLDLITGKDLEKQATFNLEQKIKINQKICQIGWYLLGNTKIWLYDVVKPNQVFSSFDFVQIANLVIKKIKQRKKTPILVGGSYFYLKHFLYGFDYKVPPNPKLRQVLANFSVEQLQQKLKQLNLQAFKNLNQSDQNNPHRLIRRIEIFTSLKKPKKTNKKNLIKPTIFIGLKFKDKQTLEQTIKKRVEERLKNGAIDEVKKIVQIGFKKTDPGLKTIGYQQIINYLEGKINKNEAINKWLRAELQYAKRQYTFMKKDKNIVWQDVL